MSVLRREWPLFLSALIFSLVMIADYVTGFMTEITTLTSGRQSDLFVSAGVMTVIILAFLEGVLGLDNATVLAIQVRHLKPADAHKALTWGIWGAFIFRFLFLLAAGFILEQRWIMALGGFYLLDMAVDFFLPKVWRFFIDLLSLSVLLLLFFVAGENISLASYKIPVWYFFASGMLYLCYRFIADRQKNKPERDEKTPPVGNIFSGKIRNPVIAAIIAVEWTDILFSFDSIGAGVALTRDFWVLFWGAFFGVACLRLFAKTFVRLLEKYPHLEKAAMLAVLIVGLKMAFEAVQASLKIRIWHVENWQTSLLILTVFVVAFFVRSRDHAANT